MRIHRPERAFAGYRGVPKPRELGHDLISYDEEWHYPPVPDPAEWAARPPKTKKHRLAV